jgi:hypothetical protein
MPGTGRAPWPPSAITTSSGGCRCGHLTAAWPIITADPARFRGDPPGLMTCSGTARAGPAESEMAARICSAFTCRHSAVTVCSPGWACRARRAPAGPAPGLAVSPGPLCYAGIQGPGSRASQCRICARVTGPGVPRARVAHQHRPARATGRGCARGCQRRARSGWRAAPGPQPGRVQAEDLRLDRVRQSGVAVAPLEPGGDLEHAEGHDLGLRRAVPDAVGSPQHPVLAQP